MDRDLYKKFMQAEVHNYPNLTLFEDGVHVRFLRILKSRNLRWIQITNL